MFNHTRSVAALLASLAQSEPSAPSPRKITSLSATPLSRQGYPTTCIRIYRDILNQGLTISLPCPSNAFSHPRAHLFSRKVPRFGHLVWLAAPSRRWVGDNLNVVDFVLPHLPSHGRVVHPQIHKGVGGNTVRVDAKLLLQLAPLPRSLHQRRPARRVGRKAGDCSTCSPSSSGR